jgi:hypothetical protein
MKKTALALLVLTLLTACSSAPYRPTQYTRQSWATVGEAQAKAECYNSINTRAGWGSNMYLCMKSKGYFEVGM